MWTGGALRTAQSSAVSNHRRNRFGLSYQYPRLALDGVASVGRENVGFKRILARRQVQLKLRSEPESPVKMVVVLAGRMPLDAARCQLHNSETFDHDAFRLSRVVPPNAKRQFLQKGSYAGDAVQVHRLDLYTPSPCRKDAVEEERHVGLLGSVIGDLKFNLTFGVVLNGEGQHAVALPKVSYSVNSIDGPKPAAFCHLRILTGRRRPFRRGAGWSRGPD
jgi:hypothetical protein